MKQKEYWRYIMNFSVCIDAVFNKKNNFVESMRTVKECGYNAVEFWSWWDKDIEAIRKEKEILDLKVAAFCTDAGNPGDVTLQETYRKNLIETIQIARTLDCSTIISQVGNQTSGITQQEHRASLLQVLAKAAPILETNDMTLVIEPLNLLYDHKGYHMSTSQDAFQIVDQIGSPNIKVLFDIYHQQITEGNLINNIVNNIDKIGHFHAAGHPGRTEITKGEIHYANVLKEIKATGYNGYVGLEYMSNEDPKIGLNASKSLL